MTWQSVCVTSVTNKSRSESRDAYRVPRKYVRRTGHGSLSANESSRMPQCFAEGSLDLPRCIALRCNRDIAIHGHVAITDVAMEH